jgi:hypothetical protein
MHRYPRLSQDTTRSTHVLANCFPAEVGRVTFSACGPLVARGLLLRVARVLALTLLALTLLALTLLALTLLAVATLDLVRPPP